MAHFAYTNGKSLQVSNGITSPLSPESPAEPVQSIQSMFIYECVMTMFTVYCKNLYSILSHWVSRQKRKLLILSHVIDEETEVQKG